MPTILTHAFVSAAFGQVGKPEWRREPRFWIAAAICAMLPDIDVIGFSFGIRYGDLLGHRGLTHSLAFAAVTALFATIIIGRGMPKKWLMWLLLFIITASHGALDAMTNGGVGVAFLSPYDTHRYFLPWRPIRVSPIGIEGFFTERGVNVIKSEFVWVWLTTIALMAIIWLARRPLVKSARRGAERR